MTFAAVLATGLLGAPIAAAEEASFDGCPVLSESVTSGPCVERLQTLLNDVNPAYGLPVTGTFGPLTRTAVLDFQGRNGLGADGIVGAEVARLLESRAGAGRAAGQPSPSGLTPSDVVVALGDSYSSGEGAGTYFSGAGPHRCHRADTAWPRLLGVTRDHLLACSGAESTDLRNVQEGSGDEISQIERLSAVEDQLNEEGQYVKAVTLTIGGNNLGFSDIIRDCYTPRGNCLDGFMRNRAAHMEELRVAVSAAVEVVADVAPHSKVVLVGYPQIVPDTNSETVNCGWMSSAEQQRIVDLTREMDTTMQRAASGVNVEYVSTVDAFVGHELCTRDSWVVPIVEAALQNPLRTEQGHPNEEGQRSLSDYVAHAIR